jgi:PleD family two-component response regulator
MLPDIDGYEVCQRLRENLRTGHIPILFLTQKDERSDRISGLELGADDYITKPFDLEDLRWRVHNILQLYFYELGTDPTTGLPGSPIIEGQLIKLLFGEEWALLYIGIDNFASFKEVHGLRAGDDVLRFFAVVLNESVNKLGVPGDFIGHVGGSNFILITTQERGLVLREHVTERFRRKVGAFYSSQERGRGFMIVRGTNGGESKAPLMSLAIGVLFGGGTFDDIHDISRAAAEARRMSRLSDPAYLDPTTHRTAPPTRRAR